MTSSVALVFGNQSTHSVVWERLSPLARPPVGVKDSFLPLEDVLS